MSLKVIDNKVYKVCNQCENHQEIKLNENVFQDISGRFLVCTECRNFMPTEYDKDYFLYHDINKYKGSFEND